MDFYYTNFCAASPGVSTLSEWRELVAGRWLPASQELPAIPKAARLARRMSVFGKLSLAVAFEAQANADEPMVFASCWGDIGRTEQMLEEMVSEGVVSPAGFTSSVHNAVAGVAGIALKNHHFAPAIAAGDLTTEAALTQCYLELAQGAKSVLLVRSEMPMPEQWSASTELQKPRAPYAWAMRLHREAPAGASHFSLTPAADAPNREDCADSYSSDVHFLLGDAGQRLHTDETGRGWRWQKL